VPLVVEMFQMSALHANTGTQTLSLYVNSSVKKVLMADLTRPCSHCNNSIFPVFARSKQ